MTELVGLYSYTLYAVGLSARKLYDRLQVEHIDPRDLSLRDSNATENILDASSWEAKIFRAPTSIKITTSPCSFSAMFKETKKKKKKKGLR